MENEYTILDVIKNSSSLFISEDGSNNILYRYNRYKETIEYTSNGLDWYPSAISLKVFATMKFIKCEHMYTIEDLIRNQGKVYILEDEPSEPTLYTVNDGILYFYAIDGQWLDSSMEYNYVMKQKFVEYTGGIKYEN